MDRRLVITCCLTLLCCIGIRGQNDFSVIRGTVVDGLSGAPIPYVNISVNDATSGAVTLHNGSYLVTGLDTGLHWLVVSCIGYRSVRDTVQIASTGDTLTRDYTLASTYVLTDEIQVTASSKTNSVHLAPASAVVLRAESIRRRQIQTFDQALDNVTGVTVTRSGGANVQSLSIRGASETAGGGIGNRVLLLIDGRPSVSPESGGALWNLVPLNALERIEVVKGAYSALFGSSAMGGVIHAITRRPAEASDTRAYLNVGFYDKAPGFANYNRRGAFHTIGLSRSHRRGRLGYLFDVGRTRNDGHRQKSAYALHNLFTKLTYDLRGNRSLSMSINVNDMFNDTPASWLSSLDPYRVAEHRKDDYQDRQEVSVDAVYRAFTRSNLQYTSRFYYYGNKSEFLFNDDPLNDSTNVNFGKQFVDREVVRTRRLGHITQFDLVADDAHYLIAGVDVKYDRTAGLPDSVLYGKHNVFHAGIFFQDEWTLSDHLILTAGIRYDHYRIIKTFTESNLSPKVAVVYNASDRLALRALVAQAFRNPPIAERFIKFEQGGGLTFQPNPDLRAERLTLSAETGINFAVVDRLTLDFALFYNRYRDLISFVQVPGGSLTFQVVNLKRAVMQGGEFSLQYRLPDLAMFKIGYTYLDASDTSEDRINDNLAYKIKHSVNASIQATAGAFDISVQGRLRSAVKEVFIYPGSEPDGYVVVDAMLRWNVSQQYLVQLSVNNIANTQYEELERYRMPGRSISFGLRGQF